VKLPDFDVRIRLVSKSGSSRAAADHGWSTGTERTYRSVVKTQVKPAFGQLCLREVTPGVVGRALTTIARNSGPGAAKLTRSEMPRPG
jgi:hypothetical protein